MHTAKMRNSVPLLGFPINKVQPNLEINSEQAGAKEQEDQSLCNKRDQCQEH